jgi:hypothetical protein
MTPKQEERIRNKIARIKKELAADKKHWGGYHHDGKGLRYLPPALYIKLKDYKGALRYLRWFDRTFTDDSGYSIFLFEWTIILFKNGKIKEAKLKVIQTFFSNTHLFDKFLEKEVFQFDTREISNWEGTSILEYFSYKKTDNELEDFIVWLESYLATKSVIEIVKEFIEIEVKLKDEPAGPTRNNLVDRQSELLKLY